MASSLSPLPAAVNPASAVVDVVATALRDRGWWVGDGLFPLDLCQQLADELVMLRKADVLARAGIGRGLDHLVDPSIRGDLIHWLDGGTAAQAALLELLRSLRRELNRRLFLGLFEFEGHFAVYPAGAGYQRHVDSFRGAANRILSLAIYLNPQWCAADGGLLRLFDPTTGRVADEVVPLLGRVAIFLSEELPHEVTVTRRDRQAIAGWFRLNTSIGGDVDPPR